MTPPRTAILIVDDSPDDREILEMVVSSLKLPHAIRCVHSGNEAVAYLNGDGKFEDRQQYPYPGYILTDLKMPDGDGFTLLDNLKNNPEWAVIPTIVLSGSADPDDVKTAFLLGAASYFVKPQTLHGYRDLLRLTFDYWGKSKTPEVDEHGQQTDTKREGKLGQRFHSPKYIRRRREKRKD